jgi:flagellar L-ring protein FlgH
MKPIYAASFVALAVTAFAVPANADTLYVPAPPPAAPGHPLNLGADHRASQVGDLVQVVFNFALNSSTSDITNVANSYTMSANSGTGLLNLPLLRLGAGLGASQTTGLNTGQTAANTFTASMEATVTQVLPSGALVISGLQNMTLDGKPQKLHVTGTVRPEDISNGDSVLSSNVANVIATFDGPGFNAAHRGLLQQIVDFLF